VRRPPLPHFHSPRWLLDIVVAVLPCSCPMKRQTRSRTCRCRTRTQRSLATVCTHFACAREWQTTAPDPGSVGVQGCPVCLVAPTLRRTQVSRVVVVVFTFVVAWRRCVCVPVWLLRSMGMPSSATASPSSPRRSWSTSTCTASASFDSATIRRCRGDSFRSAALLCDAMSGGRAFCTGTSRRWHAAVTHAWW
jgi:hypothetical protein